MSKNKKKKRVYKYNAGGNTNKAQRKARKFAKRTARRNKKSDGLDPVKTKSVKDRVANAIGAATAVGIAVSGARDIKKLKDLQ